MFVHFNHVVNLPCEFECWDVDETEMFFVRKVSVDTNNPGRSLVLRFDTLFEFKGLKMIDDTE